MKQVNWIWVIVVLAFVTLGGCANTHNVLDIAADDDFYQRTSPNSVSKMDAEGNQIASFNGLAPMQLKQDAEGNWITNPGPASVISIPVPGGGVGYIFSPKDVIIKGFRYTPIPAAGESAFSVDEVSTNISTPLAQHVAAIQIASATLEGMTKAEAEAMVRKWEEAGKMAPSVVEVVKLIMAAMFPPAALIP